MLKRAASHASFTVWYIIFYLIAIEKGEPLLAEAGLGPSWIGLINGLVFYLLLLLAYEAVLGKVERSVSVTILSYLYSSECGASTVSEIRNRFGNEYLIDERLLGLERQGFIRKHKNSYCTTRKGFRSAELLVLVKYLFSGDK